MFVSPTDIIEPGAAVAGIVTARVPKLPLLVSVPPGCPICTPVALGLNNPKLPAAVNVLYDAPLPNEYEIITLPMSPLLVVLTAQLIVWPAEAPAGQLKYTFM